MMENNLTKPDIVPPVQPMGAKLVKQTGKHPPGVSNAVIPMLFLRMESVLAQ